MPIFGMETRMITSRPANDHVSRPELKGLRAVAAMADDMRVIRTRNGGVTREDLSVVGWSISQIDTHGSAAREMAERLSHAHAA